LKSGSEGIADFRLRLPIESTAGGAIRAARILLPLPPTDHQHRHAAE
jgi:hypothetical protein